MNKKNALATIKSELLSKNGDKCHCVNSIKGEYNDILNLYSNITQGLLDSGFEQEHIEEAVRIAIESFTDKKDEPEDEKDKLEDNKKEGDEIPEEVKAGLAFLHMIGIL